MATFKTTPPLHPLPPTLPIKHVPVSNCSIQPLIIFPLALCFSSQPFLSAPAASAYWSAPFISASLICTRGRSRHSPLQSEDAVEERLLRRAARHDEDAAQHVEVEVVLGQGAHQPGLEERRPAFLEGQASSPVALMEERWEMRRERGAGRGSYEVIKRWHTNPWAQGGAQA